MYNLYIPLCGLVLSIFLIILYMAKGIKNNQENKFYSRVLTDNLFINVFCILAVYLLYINYSNQTLIKIFNRIECLFIFNYFTNIFFYIYTICSNKKTDKLYYIANIIIGFLILIMPVDLVVTSDLTYMVSTGISVNITMFSGTILLVGSFILAIKNRKILKNKIIPVIALLLFIVFVAIVREIKPEFICLEFLATFASLIMYHTIENPDVKMLNQMELAKNIAEKANMAKSDFLSSMSHEIRTPLNAIVGLSEDIVTYKEQVPKEVIEDSLDIQNASHTLLEIVGNILDINKIENNKMEIVENLYNFKEEITKMVKVTTTRIEEKPINFNLNISDDIPYELIGDKIHVKGIINNLLTNAIKYTEKGNINLNIKCINQNNICTLYITCQDTGRGIKTEMINKLFNKFERLDIEKNTTTEGTGLGLAITKSLVEMMGGKINVQSSFGTGSIFMVQLPQKISKIAPSSLEKTIVEEVKNINYGTKKLLIVDDNKLNIKVAKKSLSDFNFDIDECYDGNECLNKIVNGNEYDLILMDIMMPNMSGETAFSKLKENNNFNIPTIALTADAVSGSRERYISLGFNDYLAKPFSREQIKEKLNVIFKDSTVKNETTIEEIDRFKDAPTYVYDSNKEKND